MANDDTRARNDQTQVLGEADIVEIEPVEAAGPASVNGGWLESEPAHARRSPSAPATRPQPPPEPLFPRPSSRANRSAPPTAALSTSGTIDPAAAAAAAAAAVNDVAEAPLFPIDQAAPGAGAGGDRARWTREAEALAERRPTRAALLLCFQARVALDLDGDAAAARVALDRAASLAPDSRAVALTRRWLAEIAGDTDDTLRAAGDEIPLAGDPPERAPLLWHIAGLEEHAAGRPDRAAAALREVVALDPQDLGAHLALAALAARKGDFRAAADAWDTVAARTDDATARAALYTASASVREFFMSDATSARATYERALEADPAIASAQAALESLHLRTQAWTDYARMLVLEADRVGELEPALAHHERAGDALWECLADGPAAARCYERASELSPSNVVAHGKLAALYEQEGRYPELVRVYDQLVARLSDPTRRAGVLLRLGTLYESRLDRPEDALRAYRAALAAAPTLAAAAQALTAHYHAHGMWRELGELSLLEADRLPEPGHRAARYVAVAEQREAHLGLTDEAVELYERALSLDPGQAAALDALDRIYRTQGRWDRLIALYEQELGHARNPQRVRAIRLALASLYHERAGAPERAAAQLKAALAGRAGPADDFPTLAALARALADADAWGEYVEVLEAQARLLGDESDAVATLYRIATAIESRLDDPRRALAAYQRVLERAPRHELALHAIVRLQRGQTRWEDVLGAEHRLLDATARPEESAAILYRIGQVAEEHLARPDDAIAAYQDALLRLPAYRLARVGLERLLRVKGRYLDVAQLLEQQADAATNPTDQARLLCQAGLLRELHPGVGKAAPGPPGLEQAAALYNRAQTLSPGMAAALWGTSRIRERRGDWAGAADAVTALCESAGQPLARSRLLVRLARIHELRLGQPDRAGALYEEALAATGDPSAVFDRMRLALCSPGKDTGAAESGASQGPGPAAGDANRWLEQAAAATRDSRLSAGLLRIRAAALEHGPGRGAGAAEGYAAAVRHSPDAQALDGLARNLAAAGDAARLPQVVAARARLLRDASSRALLLSVAGALYERSGQADVAESAYLEALATVPYYPPAMDGRQRLRAAAGDWAQAAALSAEIATQSRDPRGKIDGFEQAALLCIERLGDLEGAAQHYRAVLEVEPGNAHALARTLELLEQVGDWAGAVPVLSQQIEAVTDDGARARLLGMRARILAERLGDGPAAIADLERALRLSPDQTDFIRLLAELHEAAGHWADAALAHQRLAEGATEPAARRDALLAQARIWTSAVPDYPRAQALLEEAVAIDPSDRETLHRLAEVSMAAGDQDGAVEVLQRLGLSGPPEDRAASSLALADLLAQAGDPAGSEQAAGAAFDLCVESPTVAALLTGRYRERGDLAGFAALAESSLERVGGRASGSAGALALRREVAALWRGVLGDAQRAVHHLRQMVQRRPRRAGASPGPGRGARHGRARLRDRRAPPGHRPGSHRSRRLSRPGGALRSARARGGPGADGQRRRAAVGRRRTGRRQDGAVSRASPGGRLAAAARRERAAGRQRAQPRRSRARDGRPHRPPPAPGVPRRPGAGRDPVAAVGSGAVCRPGAPHCPRLRGRGARDLSRRRRRAPPAHPAARHDLLRGPRRRRRPDPGRVRGRPRAVAPGGRLGPRPRRRPGARAAPAPGRHRSRRRRAVRARAAQAAVVGHAAKEPQGARARRPRQRRDRHPLVAALA